MTHRMRQTLQQALREDGLRRTHTPGPGRPAWPAPANTLNALLRHGYLEHSRRRNRHGYWLDVWSITDKGRQALEEPRRTTKDHGTSMNARGRAQHRVMENGHWREYSTPEPAKVTTTNLNSDWATNARHQHQDATNGRTLARELDGLLKAA